ncbi:DUF3300 domain-containing protein [Shewanella sp. Isolate11]|uniref:DUF3300 domain-containing protein n=1 Tax=Shewanella sp. Isolate11 TaxID=2908530 RepID=UPI001EFE367A|nr:DUF3300 domain-containing protein [Shewanella sp. Isolate11]MCG9696110.1 DUF3300 domain-containing protein [Shewanella sp. Isolate11]
MNSIKLWVATLVLALSASLYSPNLLAANDKSNEAMFSEPELAQILAPIALYPDSLLTHILIASTYPIELVQANRWRKQHASLSATDAVNLAEDQDWDPSVIALVGFPEVLETLSKDLDWTQKLGDAFLQNEAQVLASIQTLRQQADAADSLANMDKMRVTKVNNEIIIEPIQTQVVYVPVYDPRVVYGSWRWYNYPPVYWDSPSYVSVGFSHHGSSLFFWSSGIRIGFNYYFSAFRWHDRHIIVTQHRHSNHYRSHTRIVSSYGAQRWTHKPHHRRGVAYRTKVVKQRYNSHRPSLMHEKQQRKMVTPPPMVNGAKSSISRANSPKNMAKDQHSSKQQRRKHAELTARLHDQPKLQNRSKAQSNNSDKLRNDRTANNKHSNKAQRAERINKQLQRQNNRASTKVINAHQSQTKNWQSKPAQHRSQHYQKEQRAQIDRSNKAIQSNPSYLPNKTKQVREQHNVTRNSSVRNSSTRTNSVRHTSNNQRQNSQGRNKQREH